MLIISADGDCAPTLFVIKRKRIPYRDVLKKGIETSGTLLSRLTRDGVVPTCEKNGAVEKYDFLSWGWTFVDYMHDYAQMGVRILSFMVLNHIYPFLKCWLFLRDKGL